MKYTIIIETEKSYNDILEAVRKMKIKYLEPDAKIIAINQEVI